MSFENPSSRVPVWTFTAAVLAVTVFLVASVWLATILTPDPMLHRFALFVHLACLVAGFGAVLSVDWVGILWVLRRRRLSDVLIAADNCQGLIWVGLTGLVVSSLLLEPDPTRLLTQIKLVLVLAVAWNGLFAVVLHPKLAALAGEQPSRGLMLAAGLSTVVSQLGWWGSMVIGFINHL